MFNLFFNPAGRIGRGKWWLVQLIAGLLIGIFVIIMDEHDNDANPTPLFYGLLLPALALSWSAVCVTIKRYHDRNKSGWWYLIAFIPLIGAIWQLIECGFLGGDLHDNDYGPGPGLNLGEDINNLRAQSGEASQQVIERPSVAWNAATSRPSFGKRV
ncbi:DUF805 domain-containing protein [Aestuariivirga sp.]|uniref:DUF805 domain-containing protein n=1 Tax=Aestuariivirga sp. TaxID=2650926 RepID=UPI0039E27CB7